MKILASCEAREVFFISKKGKCKKKLKRAFTAGLRDSNNNNLKNDQLQLYEKLTMKEKSYI